MSKGSRQRPFDYDRFGAAFDKIFKQEKDDGRPGSSNPVAGISRGDGKPGAERGDDSCGSEKVGGGE